MTAEESFAAAFRYAFEQKIIRFGMGNFQGWYDDCDCVSCLPQRIIFDYLWPREPEQVNIDVDSGGNNLPEPSAENLKRIIG